MESANFDEPHDGIFGSLCAAGRTRTSRLVMPTSAQTWPAKMKVSPGSSISSMPSSISPILRPPWPRRVAILTDSIAGETIAPTFNRCRCATFRSLTFQRPSGNRTMRLNRS